MPNFAFPEESVSDVPGWLIQIQRFDEFYKFSGFEINADSVVFKWFFRDNYVQLMCEGYATIEEDKILFLQRTDFH